MQVKEIKYPLYTFSLDRHIPTCLDLLPAASTDIITDGRKLVAEMEEAIHGSQVQRLRLYKSWACHIPTTYSVRRA